MRLCCQIHPKYICVHCKHCPSHNMEVCKHHSHETHYTIKCRYCNLLLEPISIKDVFKGECIQSCYKGCRTYRRLKNNGHIQR